ncbi:MAG: ABC transporter permease [Thermoprotei archaeon]|nr:MAG: ABC transporter permease [Thermoprotei archaeon]
MIFLNLIRNTKFRVGFILLVIIVILGSFSVYSPPYYKQWYRLPIDQPPRLSADLQYILGTTSNGRSVFYILVNAIKNSFIIGLFTALIASHIGLLAGLVAGFRGGVVDKTIMLLADVIIVIPALPLYILLAMFLRKVLTIYTIGLIVSVTSWAWPTRQVRALTMSLIEREFVITAKLSGMSSMKIIVSEIFPYILGWHLANFTNTVLYAIGSESSLAVLGLSILHEDTLGTMIYWALQYGALYRGLVWWVVPPVIVIILIFTSLYLISLGISEYINPRLRSR